LRFYDLENFQVLFSVFYCHKTEKKNHNKKLNEIKSPTKNEVENKTNNENNNNSNNENNNINNLASDHTINNNNINIKNENDVYEGTNLKRTALRTAATAKTAYTDFNMPTDDSDDNKTSIKQNGIFEVDENDGEDDFDGSPVDEIVKILKINSNETQLIGIYIILYFYNILT
jgi:type IV secretory pathway VirB10-like protein